jgi:hypothetical protein
VTDQKAARKAILADAIHGTETDVPLAAPATEVAPAAPVAAAPPQTDVMALAQALALALNQNNQQQTNALQQILEAQLKLAQNPGGRHSNSDQENPRRSAFNPHGDRDYPRPGLKCHMYFGQYDDEGQIEAAYPIVEDSCSYEEQVLCNALEQGAYTVKRNDGKAGKVLVQERRDGAGKLNRIIVAFPYGWMSKEFQQALPAMVNTLEQITGQKAEAVQPAVA